MEIYDDGSGPQLYVGGWIPSIYGQDALNLARWDGSQWSAVDGPDHHTQEPTAMLAADRAYFMSEGQIVHETAGGESMSDEATLGRYLGVSV